LDLKFDFEIWILLKNQLEIAKITQKMSDFMLKITQTIVLKK